MMTITDRYHRFERDHFISSYPLIPKGMQTNCFLILSRKGVERLTQNLPALRAGEVSIKLHLEVPNALFQSPQIQAAITIPESAAQPDPISAEVQDNVRELIQSATGLEVRLILESQAPAESV